MKKKKKKKKERRTQENANERRYCVGVVACSVALSPIFCYASSLLLSSSLFSSLPLLFCCFTSAIAGNKRDDVMCSERGDGEKRTGMEGGGRRERERAEGREERNEKERYLCTTQDGVSCVMTMVVAREGGPRACSSQILDPH